MAEAGWHLGCLEQREQTSRAVLSTQGAIDLKEAQLRQPARKLAQSYWPAGSEGFEGPMAWDPVFSC